MANIGGVPFEQVMRELERERIALMRKLAPVTFNPDVMEEYSLERDAHDAKYKQAITELNNTADGLQERVEEQERRLRKSRTWNRILGATTAAGLGLAALCYFGTGKGTTQPAPTTPVPATQAPATPSQAAQYKNTVHTVAKGEVLEKIALKYAFDGKKIDDITRKVADINKLQPNAALTKDQEVRIPYNTGKGYSEITIKAKGGEKVEYIVLNAIRDYVNRIADANGLREDNRAISTLGVARAKGWNVILPIGASTAAQYNNPKTLVVVETSDGERGDYIKPRQDLTLPDHYTEVKPSATSAAPEKTASVNDLYNGKIKVALALAEERSPQGLDGRLQAVDTSRDVKRVLSNNVASQSKLPEDPALRRFYLEALQYFKTV